MSSEIVRKEIERFLCSKTPEVLCLKGKWGVGKTFTWNQCLARVKADKLLRLKEYAYISLFGINSLEDIKLSIFLNTQSINTEDEKFSVINNFRNFRKKAQRKSSSAIEVLAAMARLPDINRIVVKSSVLLIEDQIICFDDLERSGKGLELRDVLGLASFLKDERRCKIALLLNEEELGTQQIDFHTQLERVADTTLLFKPSPSEIAKIAVTTKGALTDRLMSLTTRLGIVNIRVIKKIERLAVMLQDHLKGRDEATVEQAIATLVVASWSIQQPSIAPTVDFLRQFNKIGNSLRADQDCKNSEQIQWTACLNNYPYSFMDELDEIVIEGAEIGYFDQHRLLYAANLIETRRKISSGGKTYSSLWKEKYHGSLSIDDEDFLDALFEAGKTDAAAISPMNINSGIIILRKYGRSEQADELINIYTNAKKTEGVEFFNISNHTFFSETEIDNGLRAAFFEQYNSYIDTRDPLKVLRKMVEEDTWEQPDVHLLKKQSVEKIQEILECLQGDEVRRSIELLQSLSKSENTDSITLRQKLTSALENIARKSPLRERKLQRYGISLEKS